MKKIVVSIIIVLSSITVYADTWYVATNSVSDGPGTSWSNAFHTIQQAVDVVSSNDTVLVTNGVYGSGYRVTPGYTCTNRLVITNNITVCSVNGPDVTIIDGSNNVRGVYMSAGVLRGFTIRSGKTADSGDVYHDKSGGGVNLYGGNGIVSNCIISGNTADYGGGSYYGTLYNCIIIGNTTDLSGAGSYRGTLNNCTISGNTANRDGGGSCYGTLNNCTISGNTADWYGGGNYRGTLNNCIIYYNTASYTGDNWYSNTISYSCTTPMPSGEGNITNVPHLVNISHIVANSPCVGRGSLSYSSGVDIDGESWNIPPAMGCDEPQAPFSGNVTVSINVGYTSAVPGHILLFRADIHGTVSSYRWTFGDGSSVNDQLYVSQAWSAIGDYPVVLTAWNDDNLSGISSTVVVHIVEADYYVDACNSSPSYPYTSWQTSATTIQDAVDAAALEQVAGAMVRVTNGIYDVGSRITPDYICSNRLVITNDIIVSSVNGPEVTMIDGSNSERGVYMSAGLLTGFTIRNGKTLESGDWIYDISGGGVNLYGGNGIVSNCIISGNTADYGGGSYRGMLYNCTISGNTAKYGGGNYRSTLNNCTIRDNTASRDGGGSYFGTLYNCVISGNSANNGGGCIAGMLNSCTINDNTANKNGGGSYNGTLNNCTLSGNMADYGGGSWFGELHNCIVYYNTASESGDNWRYSSMSYSCTTPMPSGSGNITNTPMFVNYAATNLHLVSGSPCIDAGNNAHVAGDVDLDGNMRISGGIVDMGAYEFINTVFDIDGDGLPDYWEAEHYGGATNANPDTICSNGINRVIDAYVAGFDPHDPAAVFDVQSVTPVSGGFVVNWNSVSGRVYDIYRTTNLMESFDFLKTNIYYPVNSYTDILHNSEKKCFYKINVRVKP